VVVLFSDHGSRYLGKIYNDEWMYDQGWLETPQAMIPEVKGEQAPQPEHIMPSQASYTYMISYEALVDRYKKYYRTYRMKYRKYIRQTRQNLGL
jgi:cystathionine beta-synthase